MRYFFRILPCLIFFMVLNNALLGQYDPENEVVTITKYHLKPLSKVEDGSVDERKELFEEYAQKMNPLSTKLKSSMMLGHYWTVHLKIYLLLIDGNPLPMRMKVLSR